MHAIVLKHRKNAACKRFKIRIRQLIMQGPRTLFKTGCNLIGNASGQALPWLIKGKMEDCASFALQARLHSFKTG